MAENDNYMTLCPHCQAYLPARTFRRHREIFFDTATNSWQKDRKLGDSSDDEISYMEVNDSFSHAACSPGHFHGHSTSEDSNDELHQTLIDHEIWDDVLDHEIDEDTFENTSLPSVDVDMPQRPSNRTLLHCLVILLAFSWTYFPIPDNAMEFLLLSLKRFFQAASFSKNLLATFALAFPGSLYLFRKEIGLVGDKFTKYVVCQTCCSLYKFEDSYKIVGSRKISKKCAFVRFPDHRQRRMRKQCGTVLLKEVTTKDGGTRLYPHKIYCYQSIIATLEQFVKRAGLTDRCELWRKQDIRIAHHIMCDVFEVRVWRDFQMFNGSSFLASP